MVNFDFTDFANGVFTPVLILPNGSQILGGGLTIVTPSNAAGTDTLSFGINGTPARNLAATDAKTAATTALTALTSLTGETLGITRAVSGGSGTAGKGYLYVEYLVPFAYDFLVGDLPNPADLNGSHYP